jgi:hypothetical protein
VARNAIDEALMTIGVDLNGNELGFGSLMLKSLYETLCATNIPVGNRNLADASFKREFFHGPASNVASTAHHNYLHGKLPKI